MNALLAFLAIVLIPLAFGSKYSVVQDVNAATISDQQASAPHTIDLKLSICIIDRELCAPRILP